MKLLNGFLFFAAVAASSSRGFAQEQNRTSGNEVVVKTEVTSIEKTSPSNAIAANQKVCLVEQTDIIGNTLQYEVLFDQNSNGSIDLSTARLNLRTRKSKTSLFNPVFENLPLTLYAGFSIFAFRAEFVNDLEFVIDVNGSAEISHKYKTVSESPDIPNKTVTTEIDFKGSLNCVNR